MMKKWLIGLGVVVSSLALFSLAFLWYSMAILEGRVVEANILRLEGAFQLDQSNLMLEYGDVRIGSYYLSPKIIVEEPRISVTTSQGLHQISVPVLELRGSFWRHDAFDIVPVGKITVVNSEREGVVYDITLSDEPALQVREAPQEKPIALSEKEPIVFFEEYRLDLPPQITANVEHATTGQKGQLVWDTRRSVSEGWQPVHYDVYPYLAQFIRLVEGSTSGKTIP